MKENDATLFNQIQIFVTEGDSEAKYFNGWTLGEEHRCRDLVL